MRWNGASWAQVPSPDPGGSTQNNFLTAVRAISASDAWAVGDYFNGTTTRTLVLHWNGSAWQQVKTPNPGSTNGSFLFGVGATSASNVWAVGAYRDGTANDQTLALHCC